MSKPKVSIIVPIYGVEKYIARCANSLFKQTYDNCEFVFVNDCTKDNSMEILASEINKYPEVQHSCKIINHTTNQGLSESRNTGIRESTGEFIMHVDSDDYIETDSVEKAVMTSLDANADVVIMGYRHIYNNYAIEERVSFPNERMDYLKQLICRECCVNIWGALYKKSLYIKNNIKTIKGVDMGEDYYTKPRLIYYANKAIPLDIICYNYVHYNDGTYTSSFSQKHVISLSKAITILDDFFKDKKEYDELKDYIVKARMQAKIKLVTAWAMTKSGGEELSLVHQYFPEKVNNTVGFQYQLVDYLYMCKLYRLLKLYVRTGFNIKKIYRKKRYGE